MRFQANIGGVTITNGTENFSCSLADFLAIEPGYALPEGATEIWSPVLHCYLIAGDQLPADSEAATYPAKIADYAAALAALHPPEPEPEPGPQPNPKAFKMTLMADPLFLQWQEDIPAIRREDLKLAAIADNWPLVQALYDQLKEMILIPEGAEVQWQALAEAHGIPLEF